VLLHKSITDSSNPNAEWIPPSQEKIVLLQLYLCQRKCAFVMPHRKGKICRLYTERKLYRKIAIDYETYYI